MVAYFKGDNAKRRVISMRVTDARHAELTRVAAANGRSLSQGGRVAAGAIVQGVPALSRYEESLN